MTVLSFAGIAAAHVCLRQQIPGLTLSIVVAAAASFLSAHYTAPAMLFALLLGIAMNFLAGREPFRAGIDLAARHVLRVGVALLGLRITFGQIAELGWQPLALVGISVTVTIALSMVVARAMRFQSLFGLLTGGATAICGASAALALAAALPNHPDKERATLFTVIGVSVLSTVAMVAYPMIVQALKLGPQASGVFLGATIHDVAQVVGAGYGISREIGDTATVVKLMRIAMLLPVIVCATMISRARRGEQFGERPSFLPGFAVAFVALVIVNSIGLVPAQIQHAGGELSRWCLIVAIAAIGMKTELRGLIDVGLKPVALMIGETLFLAALVLVLLRFASN